jgi:hypothetical protein
MKTGPTEPPVTSTTRPKVYAVIALSLALAGCASKPTYQPTDQGAFFAPYRKAFFAAAPDQSPDRQLIHLGLPGSDKVVIWYARAAGAASDELPTVALNSDVLARDRVRHFTNTHGTGRIEVLGLQPATTYSIKLSGRGIAADTKAIDATTAPANKTTFSFLFGSCFEPYDYSDVDRTGETRIGPGARASMVNFTSRALGNRGSKPAFYIGLGDQFYVDPGAGVFKKSRLAYLYGGKSQIIRSNPDQVPSFLNELYRVNFALPSMDAAFTTLPSVMMWDDHDIRDGWGTQGHESNPEWRAYYRQARAAFVAFQGARNPNFAQIINAEGWSPPLPTKAIADDASTQERQHEELDFTFDRGWATFYIADGRSAKTKGPLLIGGQYERIRKWVTDPSRHGRPTVFVFGFPVPVSANIGVPFVIAQWFANDDAHDRIHPSDRKRLLELFIRHFAQHPEHKLVILSGDVHYSSLQSLRLGEKTGRVFGYEIVSSGIAQTKYNTAGAYWGLKSGRVRDIKLDVPTEHQPWVQDHGFYAGPSFAELFVGPPEGNDSAPKLALEFFPAAFGGTAYRLSTDWLDAISAKGIETYPENQPAGGDNTTSELLPLLMGRWVESGRATPYPPQ